MSMDAYTAMVAAKGVTVPTSGIEAPRKISARLFPFQRACVAWALERGRAALFEDCGLGKGPQQLEWARHVAEHTHGRVLILAPLAVAQQTVREGVKFNIPVAYAHDASEIREAITVTNYERLDRFDAAAFSGVVLDESSILKAYMGPTKRRLVEAFAPTPFRLCCTATPAPNDYMELGNHSDFLGVLSSHEMLTRWFINDTSQAGTYRVKGHAVGPFWDWVSSWARCVGKPSDLGAYKDDGFVLPPLTVHRHVIDVDVTRDRGERLFRLPDLSATSVHQEKRLTIGERAAKVAALVAAEPHEPWLIWCETDYEADALARAIPSAVDVRGSQSLEAKEGALMGFVDGTVRVLITKPKLAGFGLNLQHCARVAFVGPTFSFEAYYQAIRRAWRFGQTRAVDVHVVMASTEVDVWNILTRKAEDHRAMQLEMFAAMRRAQTNEAPAVAYSPTHAGQLPAWLTTERV